MEVTLEAPAHREVGSLPCEWHLIYATVLTDATDAFVHVDRVIEIDILRQVVHAHPLQRSPVRQLPRTGCSSGATVQSWEWQFMQVFVGGRFANEDFSTEV